MKSGTETREIEPPSPHAVFRVDRISKTFLGQRALTEVSLDVNRGEVCGLIGHNGSGKSTLIKILSGYHEPDPGSGGIFVDGAPSLLDILRPLARAGFRFIHQELGLIDSLTVLDNLRLGSHTYQTGALWRIKRARERRSVQELLDRFEIDVDPAAKLSNLSAVQHTEIAVAAGASTGGRGPAPGARRTDRDAARGIRATPFSSDPGGRGPWDLGVVCLAPPGGDSGDHDAGLGSSRLPASCFRTDRRVSPGVGWSN